MNNKQLGGVYVGIIIILILMILPLGDFTKASFIIQNGKIADVTLQTEKFSIANALFYNSPKGSFTLTAFAYNASTNSMVSQLEINAADNSVPVFYYQPNNLPTNGTFEVNLFIGDIKQDSKNFSIVNGVING